MPCHAWPFCQLEIRAKRPNYQDNWIRDQTVSANPTSLGEHLRKVRLERRLFQKDLGKRFGVHTESVKNWETGITVPTIHVIPKIIEFLGYDPKPLPSTLSGQIAYARRRLGYTQNELAKEICCVSFKIWEWESGRTVPHVWYLSKLERLLENARINFRLF